MTNAGCVTLQNIKCFEREFNFLSESKSSTKKTTGTARKPENEKSALQAVRSHEGVARGFSCMLYENISLHLRSQYKIAADETGRERVGRPI